jgi:uncharacterized membrane protein
MAPAPAFLAPAGAARLVALQAPAALPRRRAAAARRRSRVLPPAARLIRVTVPVTVEAPRPLVFALFADLERMPAWSATLERVTRDPADPAMTDWTFAWSGVRLGWKARDTERVELERIAWSAVSGIVHDGKVEFVEGPGGDGTDVAMSVEFDAGVLTSVLDSRILGAGLMRFVEGALESDLQRFRQYVLKVQRRERTKAQRRASS